MALIKRYFTSYTGVALPFKLVGEIDAESLHNRNTYFVGEFDDQERIIVCKRVVYGEIDLEHRYVYNDNGDLKLADVLNDDGEFDQMTFG